MRRRDLIRLVVLVAMSLICMISEAYASPAWAADPGDTCAVGTLASPDLYTPYSVDYYINALDVQANSTVALYIAAYGPPRSGLPDSLAQPTVSNVSVLDADYTPVDGQSWSTGPLQCSLSGQRSTLYRYAGEWHAPAVSDPAGADYRLTVMFTFNDPAATGRASQHIVQYFINLHVAPTVSPPSPVHWQTILSSDSQALEDSNGAYDLSTMGDMLTANTSFFFQDTPAGAATIGGGMVDALPQRCDSVFVLPRSGQHQSSRFQFEQNPGSGLGGCAAPPHSLMENGGFVDDTVDTPTGCTCPHKIGIYENLRVRYTDGAYALHAGAYILDQAFTGDLQGASGRYSVAGIGEGKSFLFYTDPGQPRLEGGSTVGNATISWLPVPPSSVDPTEIDVTYNLVLCNHAASIDTVADTPGDCRVYPNLSAPTWDGALPGAHTYAFVSATFTGTDDRNVVVESKIMANNFVAASPTPTPVQGAISVIATPGTYAWLLDAKADDVRGTDRLYPTTGGEDPDQFSWPIGRPLHVLPALSEQPNLVQTLLYDRGLSNVALLFPTRVTSEDYALRDAGCGPLPRRDQVVYAHDPVAYPFEIEPHTLANHSLAGGVDMVWTDGPIASTAGEPLATCDISGYLQDHHDAAVSSAGIPLTFSVRQRLDFAVRVTDGTPSGSGQHQSCVLDAAPPASPPTDGMPAPAFASGTRLPHSGVCDATDISVAAAENALWSKRVTIVGAESSWIVPRSDGSLFTTERSTGNTVVLRFSLESRRTVQLRYHPLFLREVQP